MLKGLTKIKEQSEELAKISTENRIRQLFLRDGEFTTFRFLTEPEELIEEKVHSLQEQTPYGLKWRKYTCTFETIGMCKHCSAGNVPDKTIFLWAYIRDIMHISQNNRLETDSNAERWQQTSVGGSIYFKQEVNAPMIFATKYGKDHIYKQNLIDFAEEYGVFTDRDYKYSRAGVLLKTLYTLRPKDPTKISKELVALKSSLPKLADYVSGKVVTFDSADEGVAKTVVDKPKEASPIDEAETEVEFI